MNSHSTLPWATWEAVTSVEGNECYYHTRWLTGLRSTQANVEGMVMQASWHWGSDRSVVKDPLGEPDRAPFYVGLPSAWGSVDGDRMFSPFMWEGSLTLRLLMSYIYGAPILDVSRSHTTTQHSR